MFLSHFMPGADLEELRIRVIHQYPFPKSGTENQNLSVVARLIRDSSFTCNTRQLFDAYKNKTNVYMMNYHFLHDLHLLNQNINLAIHASDLLPTFFNQDVDVVGILEKCHSIPRRLAKLAAGFVNIFAPAYQSYLKSHAITGDPNTYSRFPADSVKWPPATTDPSDKHDKVKKVMEPILGIPPFRIAPEDPINTASICDFWNKIAADIMKTIDTQENETSLLTVQGSERPALLGLKL